MRLHSYWTPGRKAEVESRQLRYFVAVAEERNFRRAAAREGVTASTLGSQIAALEKEFGGQLFHRTTRQVRLTALGQVLLAEARRCIAALDRAQEAVRLAVQGQLGVLRLGVPVTGNPPLLDAVLRRCSERYPGLRVDAHLGYSARHAQALLGNELDAAVLYGAPRQTSELSYQRLADVELKLAVSAESPLAGQDCVRLDGLGDFVCVALAPTVSPALGPAVIGRACQRPAADVRTVDSLEAVLLAVAAGGAVALLPEAVTSTVSWRGVCYRSLGAETPTVELGISWLAGDPPAVVACLLEAASLHPETPAVD